MSEPGGDWKRQALEDFRRWLDAVGDEPPEPEEPDPADCDLRDLFAEFSALRQEIRLQNREQARAGRELSAAAQRSAATRRWPRSRSASPEPPRTAVWWRPWRCATLWCEGRTPRFACGIGGGCSHARRVVSAASSRVTSWRSDDSIGCCPGSTSGVWRPSDNPSTAGSCTRWRRAASTGSGRPGGRGAAERFVRHDDVLRLADVAVNRRHAGE